MIRVLLERGSAVVGGRVGLVEGEAHHLRVRRAKDGEPVEVRDGAVTEVRVGGRAVAVARGTLTLSLEP